MIPTAHLVLRPEFQGGKQDPGGDTSPAPARGRAAPGESDAGATGQSTTQDDTAPTQQQQSPLGACGSDQLLMLLAFVAIFYFLIIRPGQKQEKTRRAMLSAVQKGDRVATNSGLHGTIVMIDEAEVTLDVGGDVLLKFDRAAIGRVLGDPPEEKAG